MEYVARNWRFVADMNGDGAVTISDVWLWVKWLYFYPGDGVLHLLATNLPSVAKFFEVSTDSYGGYISGFISFFIWLVFFSTCAAMENNK